MYRRYMIILILVLTVGASAFGQYNIVQATGPSGDPVQVQLGPTGSAHRVFGVNDRVSDFGVKIGQLDRENMKTVARKVFERYAKLLRVDPRSVGTPRVQTNGSMWFVSALQTIDGVPVYGTEIGFTVDHDGNLVSLGADAYPGLTLDTRPYLAPNVAEGIADEEFQAHQSKRTGPPELMVYPLNTASGVEPHLVWRVDLTSTEPLDAKTFFVDADSGSIVAIIDNLRDSSVGGHVTGSYWPEHYYDSTVSTAFPTTDIRLFNIAGQLVRNTNTDSNGYYYMSGFAYTVYIIQFPLQNAYVQARDGGGDPVRSSWTVVPGTANKNWGATDGTNVRWHAGLMHDYFKNTFTYSAMDYQMAAFVDQGPGYNGAADGTSIYFGSQNGMYWARSSDVVYHEYTHNTIHHIYGGWIGTYEYGQGKAMDEGLADYFACTRNNDPIQGESVGVNRNLVNSYTWNPNAGSHWNGQVIGGACWDVRTATGAAVGDTLTFRALQITPRARDFQDFLFNMIVADNNYYGGSHHNAITTAFANHGITLPVLAVTISGPSYLQYMQSGTWTANATGGTPGYHYQWWFRYPEIVPTENNDHDGEYKPPHGVWLKLGTDSPHLTRGDSLSFDLKCVVTDALNRQATSNIKSVAVGRSP